MGKLFIMIGEPGSGKSTWLNNHTEIYSDKIVSRDEIRFLKVAENEEYFSKEKEVFKEFVDQINNGLKTHNVFADATHLSRASRNKLLRAITTKPQEINAIWIKTPLEEAIKRNENRINTRSYVPRSVIRRMFYQIEEPSFEEGFNKIYIIEEGKSIQIKEEQK